MKKYLLILLAAMCLFCLCACGDEAPEESETPRNGAEEFVIADEKYYSITELRTDGDSKYSYCVKDADGKVIESATCAEKPGAAMCSDTVVGMRFEGNNRYFCRYFDIETGRVSDSIFNAFWDNGTVVACTGYDEGHCIIVRDIFDETKPQTKTLINSDALAVTICSAELNEDGTVLTVVYVLGSGTHYSDEEYTAEVPLS